METEAELVHKVMCGDEEAFRKLYSKYSKPLIRFVYKYTGDIDMSADIVQETFVRFLENIKNYSPKGSFKSFIFTIASNIIKDTKRKERKYREILRDIAYLAEEKADERNKKEELMNFIDILPDREKRILLLRLEGYKIEEIAKIESCSSRTIKRVLKRIVNEMKSKIRFG